MTNKLRPRERTIAAWTTLVVVLGGALWLVQHLSANGPGDSGPLVGPGAAEKVRYGFVAGTIVVVAAVVIGLAVGYVLNAFARRRSNSAD